MRIFTIKPIIDEVKKVEIMLNKELISLALEAKDKTVSEVTGLFETIVNTIQYDIETVERGLKAIENELFTLATQKDDLLHSQSILAVHKVDLNYALGSVVETVAKVSPPVTQEVVNNSVTNDVTSASMEGYVTIPVYSNTISNN